MKSLRLEMKALKCRLALKDKLLKKQLTQEMQNKLSPFFTPGQIKKTFKSEAEKDPLD